MATYSSILAWEISTGKGAWWGYSPWGHKELDMTEHLSTHMGAECARGSGVQHSNRSIRLTWQRGQSIYFNRCGHRASSWMDTVVKGNQFSSGCF